MHALKPSQYGRGAGAERDDSTVVCEACGKLDHVSVEELVTAPETVPECCSLPMVLPSLDEMETR